MAKKCKSLQKHIRVVIGAALLGLGVAPALATSLSIEHATLHWDPNASTWYVSTKVCNNENGGYSGSLLYELRLTSGSRYWTIGSEREDQLVAGWCETWDRLSIDVNTNVPAGEYGIEFVIGEYNYGSYVARDSTTFSRTFLRGGGPAPSTLPDTDFDFGESSTGAAPSLCGALGLVPLILGMMPLVGARCRRMGNRAHSVSSPT